LYSLVLKLSQKARLAYNSKSHRLPEPCGQEYVAPYFTFVNHLSFYLQNVIDGDLCEQFNSIDPHKQKSISEEMDRTPNEVAKKLEDIRTRFAF